MDSVAGAWAALEGQEFCNVARTTAYLRAGYGPPNLKVEGECDCPEDQLRALVGCDDVPYFTPADDLAPWFDAAIPESADFAGLYPTTFDGLESTYTRTVTEIMSGGGGGVLGRLRAAPRTLTWRGFLFGRTCCSVAYGLRWLTSVLRQAKCGAECGGEKLDLLVCCPPSLAPVWVWCADLPAWIGDAGPAPLGWTFPADNSHFPDLRSVLPANGDIEFLNYPSLPCPFPADTPHVDYYDNGDGPKWQPIPMSNGGTPSSGHVYVVVSCPDFTEGCPAPLWHPESALTGGVTLPGADCGCSVPASPWVWCSSISAWIAPAGPPPPGYTYPVSETLVPSLSSFAAYLTGDGEVDLFSAASDFDPCAYDYSQTHTAWNPGTGVWSGTASGLVPTGSTMFVVASGPTYTTADPAPTWSPTSALTGTLSPLSGLPAPGIPAGDDAFRTLYNVGLTEGPTVRSQRSATGRCGCSTIMEVEFTLTAGNPHFYRAPVLLADAETFDVGGCPEWQVVTDPADCVVSPGIPTDCPDATTPVATDPNCPTPTLPPVFAVDESCFCDPLAPTSRCIAVPASTWGADFQGAPVFSIYSGSQPLRATTIRLVEDPLGLDCDAITADPCNFCEFITIRWFPAHSTLVIDGVNRRVTIETPGGDVQSGEQFMVGNYAWPLLECVDYCVCATVDGATAATDATFSLNVFPLDM